MTPRASSRGDQRSARTSPNGTGEPFLREIRLRRERVPSFGVYPFDLPVVRALDRLAFHPSVTFLVGENGSGKSTLLEAIAVACGFNAEGGTSAFDFATRASHSPLHEYLLVVRGARMPRDGFFLRAESLFNVATQVEQLGVTGYGDRSLHEQSHGESFMALMTNRFSGDGLYLMDESEAALSPSRQMSLGDAEGAPRRWRRMMRRACAACFVVTRALASCVW